MKIRITCNVSNNKEKGVLQTKMHCWLELQGRASSTSVRAATGAKREHLSITTAVNSKESLLLQRQSVTMHGHLDHNQLQQKSSLWPEPTTILLLLMVLHESKHKAAAYWCSGDADGPQTCLLTTQSSLSKAHQPKAFFFLKGHSKSVLMPLHEQGEEGGA